MAASLEFAASTACSDKALSTDPLCNNGLEHWASSNVMTLRQKMTGSDPRLDKTLYARGRVWAVTHIKSLQLGLP